MTYQFERDNEIKCCADCPMTDNLTPGFSVTWFCVLNYRDIDDLLIKPDWCPLVEVESEEEE